MVAKHARTHTHIHTHTYPAHAHAHAHAHAIKSTRSLSSKTKRNITSPLPSFFLALCFYFFLLLLFFNFFFSFYLLFWDNCGYFGFCFIFVCLTGHSDIPTTSPAVWLCLAQTVRGKVAGFVLSTSRGASSSLLLLLRLLCCRRISSTFSSTFGALGSLS